MTQSIWIVIPAAGKGRRFDSEIPKQHFSLLDKTVLQQTLNRFLNRKDLAGIVLCLSSDDDSFQEYAKIAKLKVVNGGDSRADSVYNALLYLETVVNSDDLIAVHDAARPCVRQSKLDELFALAKRIKEGAILAFPATDTIKLVEHGRVKNTFDRKKIWSAQTPQIFRYQLLREAFELAQQKKIEITDESSAVELLGIMPQVVMGHKDNIKITTPEDLNLAAFFLEKIIKEND